jgi:ArsR family transcriptional regulator, arsenate/arsenite/antimonite-responsive transcriptional repressor
MAKYSNDHLRELLAITKAVADENRVRILMALRKQSLCVCQITELLQLAPSTVSKHISILRQARLVEPRKEGRWIHYYIPIDRLSTEAADALRLLSSSLRQDARVAADRKRMTEILKIDREELCHRL